MTAPYAAIAIPLYLNSVSGMKYRTLSCMECGRDFLERDGDILYRTNDDSLPNKVVMQQAATVAKCGDCQQTYAVYLSIEMRYEQGGVPLYLQPQSLYLAIEPAKKLRDIYCLECGKKFHTISDRIGLVSDNRLPMELMDPGKAGPIEARCGFNKCSQTWALMV